MEKALENRLDWIKKRVSALWNLTRVLLKWIQETQKGQDSIRSMIEKKEYKKLLDEVKDGSDWMEEFLKGERREKF